MQSTSLSIASAAILALTATFAPAADGWTADYPAAQKTAVAEKKDLLLSFTGSDWCPPCKMLNSEVFSQEAFLSAASEHFVLVMLDFPKNEALVTEDIRKQNEGLAEKYAVEGFPTVLLCDAQGRVYGATGHREGGVQPYLEHLAKLRENRAKRDAGFESAQSAEGVEKAKTLFNALTAMEMDFGQLQKFYADEIALIQANDPDDQTGLAKKIAAQERLTAFVGKINEHAEKGDFVAILPLVDEMLQVEGLEPVERQQITLTRASVFAQLRRFDDALQVVDDAAKIAPDSEIGPYLDDFKVRLIEARDAMAAEKTPASAE